jgi:hypothetical protein
MTVGNYQFFDLISSRYSSNLSTQLQIQGRVNEELILPRLLSGTLGLKNLTDGTYIKQQINYTLLDFQRNRVVSTKPIREFLESGNKISDFEKYLQNSIHFGNKKLFRKFLLELSNYFHCTSKNKNVSGFLHLYRSLELISYCFPLYYASRNTDYHGSFILLKSFFNKTDGERDFFKQFVNNHLFRSDPILDIRLPIKINGPNGQLKEQYFNSFMKIYRQYQRSIELLDNTPYDEIVTKRRSLIPLIIALRNRTFHLLEGDFNDNLTCEEIFDLDGFFKNFNDTFLNWIALIYIKILNSAIEQTK